MAKKSKETDKTIVTPIMTTKKIKKVVEPKLLRPTKSVVEITTEKPTNELKIEKTKSTKKTKLIEEKNIETPILKEKITNKSKVKNEKIVELKSPQLKKSVVEITTEKPTNELKIEKTKSTKKTKLTEEKNIETPILKEKITNKSKVKNEKIVELKSPQLTKSVVEITTEKPTNELKIEKTKLTEEKNIETPIKVETKTKEIYKPHDFFRKKQPVKIVQSDIKRETKNNISTLPEHTDLQKKSKSARRRAKKQEKKRLERLSKQGYDIKDSAIIDGVKDPNWIPNFSPTKKQSIEKKQINQTYVKSQNGNTNRSQNNGKTEHKITTHFPKISNEIEQNTAKQQTTWNEKRNNIIKPIPFVDLTKLNSEQQKEIKIKSHDVKDEIVPVNVKKLLSPLERKDPFFQIFFRDVERFLIFEMLVEKGSKVLIGVSGGVDSVVLLDVLANLSVKYNFSIYVCHYNHNIRPNSVTDENFVKSLAANYNVPFYSSNGKVLQYAEKHSISVEEAARVLRYQFYERISRTIHADFLATAHTTDDAAETFLLNLLRGTGLTGLSGIPSRRTLIKDVILIRPLLNMPKQKLIEYADRRNINWREDETNLQDKYTRNKIRLDLIPKLKKDYTPAIIEIINRSAKLLQGADRIIHDYVRTHLPSLLFDITNESVSIKENIFKTFDEFIRGEMLQTILMKYFRMLPPPMKVIDRIIKLANSDVGAICEISKTIIAIKDRQAIVITRKQTPIKINEKISKTGRFEVGNLIFVLKEIKLKDVEYNNNPNIEYFDADALSQSLVLRNWIGIDEFNPLGMSGKMKVSDFLTNEKTSVLERPNILVLVDSNNEIVWVCKIRISDKFKVTSKTKNVIKIEIKNA